MQTITLSPSSIMLKSAMAWPTWRCSFLESLFVSCTAFASASWSCFAPMAVSSDFFQTEHLAPDQLAIGAHVGLLRRHLRCLHARVGEHQRQHVVAQRFLQVDMALADALADGAPHEVVVDHFVQRVVFR